ncbi:MAG: Alkaline phosphatase synthesis transcriptional regulatory protein PhoP [Syntrophorhabdus sp. PtaU1.Bin153]|nr:MAG: Alkaline phosphatase synthesis transcriptional regulatory protein PhoP [Syntrophorhabdus sp. PtaU1.Bin153]
MEKPGVEMGRQFKVLVVDDDEVILLLSTTLLQDAGYEVLEASTGEGCLDAVQTHHPDIILLDVMLPDMTGIEVCKQIKNDKNLEDIFVILASGIQISSEHQAEGLDIGADGYIIRPISNKEFLARVQAGERIKRAEDALREKEREQQLLISQLKEALVEIKTLKGYIPICSCCKKIRDDEGYWNQLETYISKHTDAVFSHGLCPECVEQYRVEMKKLSKKQ